MNRNLASLKNYLKIEFPLIMAPMFLVSNVNMVVEAMKSGIAGTIPSLNYRTGRELEKALNELNAFKESDQNKGTYGVNLIVHKTNSHLSEHLDICIEKKVPFFITSLGTPKEVIEKAKNYGAKVFSDVTNLSHAGKVYDLGVDGFIAVGSGAGGHAGPYPNQLLVPALKKQFPDKLVIAAGGVASGSGILSMVLLGAAGVSVGTLFIASNEAEVSKEYKEAIINAGMKDIVITNRISGAPLSIINTPFARKIGAEKGWLEKYFYRYFTETIFGKSKAMEKGIKMLERSIKPGNYNNLWVTGHSVEMIDKVRPVSEIISKLKEEFNVALRRTCDIKI